MKWTIVLLVLFCLCLGHEAHLRTASGCPNNWIRHADSDRCYFISNKKTTFNEAKKHCDLEKSELIPPITCLAEFYLSSLLAYLRQDQEFWIGVNDLNGTNDWTTTKGLPLDKIRRFWEEDFPRGKGRCALLSFLEAKKRGAWRNDDCHRKLKYVCIKCPNDFDYIPEIDQCLYLNLEPKNWQQAENACSRMKMGARMLSIENSVKQKTVRRYLEDQFTRNGSDACSQSDGGKTVWMGGQTKDPKQCTSPYNWKQYRAADTPFAYTNWYSGMPNCTKDNGSCASIATSRKYDYQWVNNGCGVQLCSVCEFY